MVQRTTYRKPKFDQLWDMQRLQQMVMNAVSLRRRVAKQLLDPRRDINDECGYPETSEITTADYQTLYDRHPLARRGVQMLPKECFKVTPQIYETEDPDDNTDWEKRLADVMHGMRGDSWYRGETGSGFFETLLRMDIQSRIGRFGALFLGFDDGRKMEEEVDPGNGRKLLFMRTFPESLVRVLTWERDPSNPRFGQPVTYAIDFESAEEQPQSGVQQTRQVTRQVHWSRVVHVADNLQSSEHFGTPEMQPYYDRLLDTNKLYGGSAEMYWRGALPGFAFLGRPEIGSDPNADLSSMRDDVEQFMNTLQRYTMLFGMDVKSLAPQVVDPTPQIDVQITAICIIGGYPKRIYMGSERGELASGQDDQQWNDVVRARQHMQVTPRLIVPLIDRLIMAKVLPEPKEGYDVGWPDLHAVTDEQRAANALTIAKALSAFLQGQVDQLVDPLKYLTKWIGLEKEEAVAMLEERLETFANREGDPGASQEGDDDGEGTSAAQQAQTAA